MKPGDCYVTPHETKGYDTEWLIVREHPDDPAVVLIVPTDSGTVLVGAADVVLPITRPLVVRCGKSVWTNRQAFIDQGVNVGEIETSSLKLIVAKLAALARGKTGVVQGNDDDDPAYERLCKVLETVGRQLRAKE